MKLLKLRKSFIYGPENCSQAYLPAFNQCENFTRTPWVFEEIKTPEQAF